MSKTLFILNDHPTGPSGATTRFVSPALFRSETARR